MYWKNASFLIKSLLFEDKDYHASMNELDYMSGKIYKMLNEKGLNDDTIIYFTSDNGPQLDLKGPSAGPFTGTYSAVKYGDPKTGKSTTWEGGMRVPGFILWEGRPDIIKPNTISKQIYSLMDILPTILELNGVSPLNPLDGVNMLPNLYESDLTNRMIYYYNGGALYAVRYGRWKIHFYTASTTDDSHFFNVTKQYHNDTLIFDLEMDLSERNAIPPEIFDKKHPGILAYVANVVQNHRDTLNPPRSVLNDRDIKYKVCCDQAKDCFCDH